MAMSKTISAAEANRMFSRLLRDVRDGKSFVVTSHGKPVAQIVPAQKVEIAARNARQQLMKRLAKQPAVKIRRWTRDELYERDR